MMLVWRCISDGCDFDLKISLFYHRGFVVFSMNKIIFPSLEKLTFLTRIYFFERDIFGKNTG